MTRGRVGWADAELVRQHHRQLRDVGRMHQLGMVSPAYRRAMRESLQRLADQGYGLEETAVMFGVSRERCRQWAAKYGLTQHFKSLGTGTKPRVWDDDRNCFVPRTWDTYRAAERAEVSRKRLSTKAAHRHTRRVQSIVALRDLAKQLKRTPTLGETSETLGCDFQGIALLFSGRSQSRRLRRGLPTPYGSFVRRWFRLAGLTPRQIGGPGHLGVS